ncbi:MAG: type II toxin-antitoxin system RelE/ParE family toxin [Gemmataceae bacterium]
MSVGNVKKLPEAEKDLIEISLRIALDNPFHADRYLDLLDEKMRLLATSPRMGRLHPELSAGLRGFAVDDYIVFYREAIQGIDVVRVLHGARDIDSLFSDDPC